MEKDLAPVQKWYLDELRHLNELGKVAKYKVDVMSLEAAKKAIIEAYLDGDVKNLYNPDVPKTVKDQWNAIGSKKTALLMEAVNAHKNLGTPSLSKYEDEELPEFIRDDIGRWTEVKERVSAGWYQNSVGVLYHYDGVVWDEVPSEKINDLEYLGG